MKNITCHTGLLQVVRRLPSSVNGNPRYEVRLDGWTARTAPDSSVAYEITNFDGHIVTAEIGTYYGHPTIRNIRRPTP